MLQRIQELMAEHNLSASQFADAIGIQRSGMSHLLSGRNKPSLDFVLKVLNRFPEISLDWLVLGRKGETIVKESGTHGVSEKSVMPTLFDQPEPEPQPRPVTKAEKPVRTLPAGRQIEKVVFFYNDMSFREYFPEK